jgi:hypothetical protein
MRTSRRYSSKRDKDDMLLYFMCIIALIQIFYLIVNKKYTSFLVFCIIGVSLNLFIKNMSIVLILDIIITNILMKTVIKREGFEGGTGDTGSQSGNTGSTGPESDDTKPAVGGVTPSEPSKIESFDNHDQKIKSVNNSILMLSNLLDKFSSVSSNLGFK